MGGGATGGKRPVIHPEPQPVPIGPQLAYRSWPSLEDDNTEWQWAVYQNCVTLGLVDYETGEIRFYRCFKPW